MPRGRLEGFVGGAMIGTLGGLIGLGGAEFRLPLLLGPFAFAPLQAVILNKAMSLVVVTSALPFRAPTIPFAQVVAYWQVLLTLLAGSLVGAWTGASWAVRLSASRLRRVIAFLLALIAVVLLLAHGPAVSPGPSLAPWTRTALGVAAGCVIGTVAAVLGVAGGELLIPTIILLFGVDVKLAGSLSLAVSLPTMLAGFARYSRDRTFAVLHRNASFALWMGAGSLCGTFLGGRLLPLVPSSILLPGLALILVISAVKLWRYGDAPGPSSDAT